MTRKSLKLNYTLITDSTYRGYPVQYSAGQSPLIKEALDKFIDQMETICGYYQDVFLVRFDLHLPKISDTVPLIPPNIANERVSELFAQLRNNKFKQKLWSGQAIKRSAYGWCNEIEKVKQLHYHCWLAVPKGRVDKAGSVRKREDGTLKTYGLIGMIHDMWQSLNPEGYSHVHCNAQDAKRLKSNNADDMNAAIEWLSYMAKQRGKVIHEGDGGLTIRVRRFDGSRMKPAANP